MREKERTMDMKKLLGLALACALLLTGCGARGGDKGEELGDNTIRPLELTEEEEALLKLVGGSDAEYGLFECAAGEGVSDCTVEVLSWEDGAWQTVAEGGVSISAAGTRRLGVVLSGDKITVNVQDGGTQYSYAPRLDGMDRGLETGRASVWLEEDQAMTIGERTPLYLEIYDDGEGVGIPPLPGGFSDLANLNQYDRAYAVAVSGLLACSAGRCPGGRQKSVPGGFHRRISWEVRLRAVPASGRRPCPGTAVQTVRRY